MKKSPEIAETVAVLEPELASYRDHAPMTVVMLDTRLLHPHPKNPRSTLTAKSVEQLRLDIEANGQKQPCLVRPHPDCQGEYQVILGHRRTVVQTLVGKPAPCVVEGMDDATALYRIYVDHMSAEDPDPFLESVLVAELLELPGWGARDVADKLGKPVAWVAARANLRTLAPSIRALAEDPGHPFSLWTLDGFAELAKLATETQEQLVEERPKHLWRDLVDRRALDDFLGRELALLGKAPFDVADGSLYPSAGACTTCPFSSSRCRDLFDGDGDLDPENVSSARCRQPGCYARKVVLHTSREVARAREKAPDAILIQGALSPGCDVDDEAVAELVGGKVLSRYDVKKAKKSDKGAVQAIVAGGPKSGEITYVIPPRGEGAAGIATKKKATKSAKPVPPAQELKESRARIDARRQAFVVDAIAAAIEKRKESPAFSVVLGLAAAFQVSPGEGMYHAEIKNRRKLYELEESAWEKAVWPRVRPHLSAALKRWNPAQLGKEHELALWLGEILKLDLGKIEAEAKEEIPDTKKLMRLEAALSSAPARKAPEKPKKQGSPGRTSSAPKDDGLVHWVEVETDAGTRCSRGTAKVGRYTVRADAVTCARCLIASERRCFACKRTSFELLDLGANWRSDDLCTACPVPKAKLVHLATANHTRTACGFKGSGGRSTVDDETVTCGECLAKRKCRGCGYTKGSPLVSRGWDEPDLCVLCSGPSPLGAKGLKPAKASKKAKKA